jgi:hypothetical protein
MSLKKAEFLLNITKVVVTSLEKVSESSGPPTKEAGKHYLTREGQKGLIYVTGES